MRARINGSKLKPVKEMPGFFRAAGSRSLAVNEEGVVIDVDTLEEVTVKIYAGYPTVYDRTSGKYKYVHRLVAMTFLEDPESLEGYVVNHIDGDKLNPHIDNLEWVTYTGNLRHAYETGLRTDNHQIEVKDLRDGSVKEFISLWACARYFKRNGEAIHRYLKSKRNAPFMRFYSIRRVTEEWPKLSKRDIGKRQNGRSRAVVAFHLETKEGIIFPSTGAAAKALGFSPSLIFRELKKKPSDPPYKGWRFYYLDDNKDVLDFAKKVDDRSEVPVNKPITPKRKPLRVLVKNTRNGKTKEYESISAFARTVKASLSYVRRSVWKNQGKYKHYDISYTR